MVEVGQPPADDLRLGVLHHLHECLVAIRNERAAVGNVALARRQRSQHGVQADAITQRQVFQRGHVGVVAGELGIGHHKVDSLARNGERAVDVGLVGAATAAAYFFAGEIGRLGEGRVVLVDEERGGRGVVGLGEVELLHALGRDGHGADAQVPTPGPAASGDERPVRRHKANFDAQPLGNLGRRVDVEARELVGRLLVAAALGIGRRCGVGDQLRLRRVGRVGGDDELAARLNLA